MLVLTVGMALGTQPGGGRGAGVEEGTVRSGLRMMMRWKVSVTRFFLLLLCLLSIAPVARRAALASAPAVPAQDAGAGAWVEDLLLRSEEPLSPLERLAVRVLERSLSETLHAIPLATIQPRWDDVDRRDVWMYELLRDLYRDRQGRPIFVRGAELTPSAHALLEAIARVDAHGIDPSVFLHAELRELYGILSRPVEDPDLLEALLPDEARQGAMVRGWVQGAVEDPFELLAPQQILQASAEELDEHFALASADQAGFLAFEIERKRAAAEELELLLAEQLVRYAATMRYGNAFGAPSNPAMDIAREFLGGLGALTRDPPHTGLLAALEPSDPRSVDEWRLDEMDMLLAIAAGQRRLGEALQALEPSHVEYVALQQALMRYRAYAAQGSWPRLTVRQTLRPGQRSPLAVQLRERLRREEAHDAPSPEDPQLFDDALAASLIAWKQRHQLQGTPVLDAATRDSLNVPVEERIAQIIVSLESLRERRTIWDEEQGRSHVRVNIPRFRAELVADGEILHGWRVVVGRVRGGGLNFTREFSALLTEIELNPFWYPPARLVRNRAAQEPGQRVVVPPGPNNPMGRAKFIFPNPWVIYMHDTNHRQDFGLPFRSLSAGCVRVDGAEELAALIIARDRGESLEEGRAWVERQLATRRRQRYYLHAPLPVHIEYRTAFLEDDGEVAFGTDLYGLHQRSIDRAVRETLQRFPELIPERPADRHARTARLSRSRDD